MEQTVEPQMKFCKWCGHKIPREAVICTACGCQVEELKSSAPTVAPSIVVQNTNTSQSTSSGMGGQWRGHTTHSQQMGGVGALLPLWLVWGAQIL